MFVLRSLIIVWLGCVIADSNAPSTKNSKEKASSLSLSMNVSSVIVTQSSTPSNFEKTNESGSGKAAIVVNNTHKGREHVVSEDTLEEVISKPPNQAPNFNITSVPPSQEKEKQIVRKDGVQFPEELKNINASNTLKPQMISTQRVEQNFNNTKNSSEPTKPTITETDSEHFNETVDDSIKSLKKSDSKRVNQPVVGQKSRTDYIVPIVAVIMSVPLVAILISLAYKRGTDWWQHRNYKRMDFLIEGMYNN